MNRRFLFSVYLLLLIFSNDLIVESSECNDYGECSGEELNFKDRKQLLAQIELLRNRNKKLEEMAVLDSNKVVVAVPNSDSVTGPSYDVSRQDLACAIITTKRYHKTKAAAAKQAWGQFCGVVMYISADYDATLPTTVIENSEEGKIINKKVFGAFAEMWQQFGDKSNSKQKPKWFIKADDDTFMQLDNLASLLSRYNFNEHHYIGRAGEWHGVKYCGGGAGYVLSRALLRDWAPIINSCQRLPVGEDVSVGKCLHDKLNVVPSWHAGFYHRSPSFFLNTAMGRKDHPEGLSPRPISFHSLSPEEQYTLSYLLYDANGQLEIRSPLWKSDPWPKSIATH